MNPDAYIEVRFKTTAQGGRKTSVSGDFYACPMFIDGKGYDCRLLIKGMELSLGASYKVPVKFLNRDLALKNIAVGTNIILWEGKDVAEGKILEIT